MTKLGNVMIPVADLDEALAFYSDALGLPVKFRDGDRFAALDGGGTTVALVTSQEQVAGAVVAPSYKVDDVGQAVRDLEKAGAAVVRAPETGPHEIRAVLRDPSGNLFIVYGGLS
ncbi:VOC family protein [Streptosporangiaceae bacterium NEAU-GS5]|nr:VOC family protein [Streptosporangiaceae bacterium NEAU-GS5]